MGLHFEQGEGAGQLARCGRPAGAEASAWGPVPGLAALCPLVQLPQPCAAPRPRLQPLAERSPLPMCAWAQGPDDSAAATAEHSSASEDGGAGLETAVRMLAEEAGTA